MRLLYLNTLCIFVSIAHVNGFSYLIKKVGETAGSCVTNEFYLPQPIYNLDSIGEFTDNEAMKKFSPVPSRMSILNKDSCFVKGSCYNWTQEGFQDTFTFDYFSYSPSGWSYLPTIKSNGKTFLWLDVEDQVANDFQFTLSIHTQDGVALIFANDTNEPYSGLLYIYDEKQENYTQTGGIVHKMCTNLKENLDYSSCSDHIFYSVGSTRGGDLANGTSWIRFNPHFRENLSRRNKNFSIKHIGVKTLRGPGYMKLNKIPVLQSLNSTNDTKFLEYSFYLTQRDFFCARIEYKTGDNSSLVTLMFKGTFEYFVLRENLMASDHNFIRFHEAQKELSAGFYTFRVETTQALMISDIRFCSGVEFANKLWTFQSSRADGDIIACEWGTVSKAEYIRNDLLAHRNLSQICALAGNETCENVEACDSFGCFLISNYLQVKPDAPEEKETFPELCWGIFVVINCLALQTISLALLSTMHHVLCELTQQQVLIKRESPNFKLKVSMSAIAE